MPLREFHSCAVAPMLEGAAACVPAVTRRGRRTTGARAVWSLFATLGLFAAGCGHPATEAECTRIFERSGELELAAQNVSDPEIVRTRIAALRSDRGEELIRKCVGRRVTSDALACVERATTPSGVDACFY